MHDPAPRSAVCPSHRGTRPRVAEPGSVSVPVPGYEKYLSTGRPVHLLPRERLKIPVLPRSSPYRQSFSASSHARHAQGPTCVRRSHASSILLCVMNVWELQREGTRRLIVSRCQLTDVCGLRHVACCTTSRTARGLLQGLAAHARGCVVMGGAGWRAGQGRETGERRRRAARRGASPLPVLVISGPPLCRTDHCIWGTKQTVYVREHASSNSYRLIWGRLAWAWGGGGGV
jgi:hypothetical protein